MFVIEGFSTNLRNCLFEGYMKSGEPDKLDAKDELDARLAPEWDFFSEVPNALQKMLIYL